MACHYCGEPAAATRDHIVPLSRGGLDVIWNIVWACASCNVQKSDNWPTCTCNRCRASRRRHLRELGIDESTPKRG